MMLLDLFTSRRPCVTPPFWMMRQAGRYLPEYQELRQVAGGFMSLCLTPTYAAEVTLQPVRRFGLDAAILFSDILMVPYGLGQDVDFLEGHGPVLGSLESVTTEGSISGSFLERLEPVFAAARLVRQKAPDVPLIGFVGGPWTVLCYMIQQKSGAHDFFEAKAFAYDYPVRFQALLERVIQASLLSVRAQIQAGCQIIQIFESAAGVLSDAPWHEWVLEVHRHLVQSIHQAHPGIPVIGFPRGVGDRVIEYAKVTGVDGVGIDALASAERIRQALPDVVVQGGLHPDLLRLGGAPLLKEIDHLCHAYKDHPYILNLSHGVHPQTPVEHVQQVIEHRRAA